MRSSAAVFIPFSLLVVAAAACSSTNTIIHVTSDGGTEEDVDAGEPVAVDAGGGKDSGTKKDAGVVVSENPQSVPPVLYNGGALILSPSLVSVTFDSDTLRTNIESFDDTIGTTPYWDAVRAGFCDKNNKCIGQATGGGHVHLATNTLQGSYTDSTAGGGTIQSMITNLITAGTLPTPTANTLYMIYFPSSSTDISLDGQHSCQAFGGYHNSMKYNAVEFAYAIMPRCATGGGATADFNQLTNAASHELAEAATDPFISTDPMNPYTGYGAESDAWDLVAGGEVGDRCFDILGSGNDVYTQGSYQVQRIFNNMAAAGKHDPCVPAPNPATTPYFNVAPLASAGDIVTVPVGTTANIQIQGISDGPLGSIAYDLLEITKQTGKSSTDVLTLSGGGSIAIGAKASISVTLNSTPMANGQESYAVFLVRSQSKQNGPIHYWPFVITAH